MAIVPDRLDELLTALERQLHRTASPPQSLAVCGGSALAALGLMLRTTRDVDVLGAVSTAGRDLTVAPLLELPEPVRVAARVVARDFGLGDDWLNTGPARQVDMGLPEGLAGRLVRRNYGLFLTVFFIGRFDQIHFKLYAAVDRNDYHTNDLLALKPTPAELLTAARWTLSQDVSEPFRTSLRSFLLNYGFESIAQEL